MTKITIDTIERLPEAAAQFISEAEARFRQAPGAPKVIALRGPMGAGKTTLISEVCRQLGSLDEASSPTFSIVNEYDTEKWGKVYHLDCYRFESEEEGYEVGVEDYFASGRPNLVEWPERIEGLLPEETLEVRISAPGNDTRIIEIL